MEKEYNTNKRQGNRQIPDDYDLGYVANVSDVDADYNTIPEIYY